MLGDEIGSIQFHMGVELKVRHVHIGRNLLGPGAIGLDGQHAAEVALRTGGHQIAHGVAQAHQCFAQIPDDALGTAIGKNGNGRVIDEQNVHDCNQAAKWRGDEVDGGKAESAAGGCTGCGRRCFCKPWATAHSRHSK